jgi:hypothetical protein
VLCTVHCGLCPAEVSWTRAYYRRTMEPACCVVCAAVCIVLCNTVCFGSCKWTPAVPLAATTYVNGGRCAVQAKWPPLMPLPEQAQSAREKREDKNAPSTQDLSASVPWPESLTHSRGKGPTVGCGKLRMSLARPAMQHAGAATAPPSVVRAPRTSRHRTAVAATTAVRVRIN